MNDSLWTGCWDQDAWRRAQQKDDYVAFVLARRDGKKKSRAKVYVNDEGGVQLDGLCRDASQNANHESSRIRVCSNIVGSSKFSWKRCRIRWLTLKTGSFDDSELGKPRITEVIVQGYRDLMDLICRYVDTLGAGARYICRSVADCPHTRAQIRSRRVSGCNIDKFEERSGY